MASTSRFNNESSLPYNDAPGDQFDQLVWKSDDGAAFEQAMKERNRMRKEKEEFHLAELKVQIARLEDALAAETRRRVDATSGLDDEARQQVFDMESRLQNRLHQDNAGLQKKLDRLEDRIRQLELQFERQSQQQLSGIEKTSAEFGKTLEQLQQEQDYERKARLKREGILLQQVESHAKEMEDRWDVERKERKEQLESLEQTVQEQHAKQLHSRETFQGKVKEELEALREDLEQETRERQAQDEEIVAALNRYAQQLQQSLSILSSD